MLPRRRPVQYGQQAREAGAEADVAELDGLAAGERGQAGRELFRV